MVTKYSFPRAFGLTLAIRKLSSRRLRSLARRYCAFLVLTAPKHNTFPMHSPHDFADPGGSLPDIDRLVSSKVHVLSHCFRTMPGLGAASRTASVCVCL
jgi:hypothetical protein